MEDVFVLLFFSNWQSTPARGGKWRDGKSMNRLKAQTGKLDEVRYFNIHKLTFFLKEKMEELTM